MASATGIPDGPVLDDQSRSPSPEREPLLGRPGDVKQTQDQNILGNLTLGTAAVAQAGILILVALVWSGVFSNDLIFFSPHPLLNSAAVLLSTQAILILQPTQTASQKHLGTFIHFGFISVANLAFVAAFTIIEVNKRSHPETRFTSVHGILGLITYICLLLQVIVGFSQFFLPITVFGSVDNGKKVYKWHRLSGYVILLLELATIAAATQTGYNLSTLRIRLWAVLVASVLVIAGVGARIKKYKLGIV